ncbi:MAG: hypothetical protein PHY30_03110 [Candidatus Pacebacteria bacterium]|nr:hypothetical protein [Candidatus Paceibacterota bacterium]
MTKTEEYYFCNNCKKNFDSKDKICSICGEKSKELYIKVIEDIKVKESTIGKLKNLLSNFKNHIKYEFFQGWKKSKDKEKHPEGINLLRQIDRGKDEYIERCVDISSGKEFVNKNKKLSEHHNTKKK